ncbi:TRAP transporter small permease [Aliiglaciecola sp. SL4]|uniref:TRAP transporter small permease n=1 Tax=Aliiglaciecola sp. SL4 TaxID=3239806 RepID=UPI00355BBED8
MMQVNLMLEKLDYVLSRLLAFIMVILVVDVAWQVITRFILPKPSSFTEEVARFLLIWLSLLGAAYAYKLHAHLGLDILVRKLSAKNALRVFRFNCFLVAIFSVVILIGGGSHLVWLTWVLGQQSPVLNMPMAYVYVAIPLSGLIFFIYSISFIFAPTDTKVEDAI